MILVGQIVLNQEVVRPHPNNLPSGGLKANGPDPNGGQIPQTCRRGYVYRTNVVVVVRFLLILKTCSPSGSDLDFENPYTFYTDAEGNQYDCALQMAAAR